MVYAGLFIIFVVVIVLTIFRGKEPLPGPEYDPSPKNVSIYDKDGGLYKFFGSRKFDALQIDLRAHFDSFVENDNKSVAFNVSKKSIDGITVSISGSYGRGLKSTEVIVKNVSNDRLEVTITTGNKVSKDSLPSNSGRNQFIATLPIDYNVFRISYLPDTDKILVTYENVTLAVAKQRVTAYLSNIKEVDFTKEDIQYFNINTTEGLDPNANGGAE